MLQTDRVRIPAAVSTNDSKPGIITASAVTKQTVMVELTVPTQDRIEVAGKGKRLKKYRKESMNDTRMGEV